MKQRTNKLPLFFNYNEEKTDNGYESIQDFFISWTLRCAAEEYKAENPLLNLYSTRIVYALIFGYTDNNGLNIDRKEIQDFEVINVVTKLQNTDCITQPLFCSLYLPEFGLRKLS